MHTRESVSALLGEHLANSELLQSLPRVMKELVPVLQVSYYFHLRDSLSPAERHRYDDDCRVRAILEKHINLLGRNLASMSNDFPGIFGNDPEFEQGPMFQILAEQMSTKDQDEQNRQRIGAQNLPPLLTTNIDDYTPHSPQELLQGMTEAITAI